MKYRLYIVAVRIDYKGAIVVCMIIGAYSRCTIVGTAAMLWVGGSIILHGLDVLGLPWLYDTSHHLAVAVANAAGFARGFVEWLVTATLSGVFGMALGALLIAAFSLFDRRDDQAKQASQ